MTMSLPGAMMRFAAWAVLCAIAWSCASTDVLPIVEVSPDLVVTGDVQARDQWLAELDRFLRAQRLEERGTFRGALSKFVVESITSDRFSIAFDGCARFGQLIYQRHSASVFVFKVDEGWRWYPLEVSTKGVDTPPLPCR